MQTQTRNNLTNLIIWALLALFLLLGPMSVARGEDKAPAALAALEHHSLAPLGQGPAPAQPVYPAPDVIQQCQRKADELRKQLDDSFIIRLEPPFVVAGNVSADELDRCISENLTRPAKAMWSSYFRKRPDKVITVLLLGDRKSYEKWAMKLFRDDDLPYFGYYKPYYRTLIMNIATGPGVLTHELTHALIAYDFPSVPLWFNEAMASLHEQSVVCEKGLTITGTPNWRLTALQRAIRRNTLRPLRDLITKRDFYDDAYRGDNYAQARYFAYYLQSQGLLKTFYEYFRDHGSTSDGGIKAIEAVMGKKLEEVEKDYKRWALTLKIE